MKRATATARRERPLGARGPVGFAVRDLAGRGHAFQIDADASQPLVFGAVSPIRVVGPGVLPAHFVVLPHDGVLVAASASAANPAMLNGAALPTTWTLLEVPSRVRLGTAAVDFFYADDSGTLLVDLDIETTVTGSTPPPASLSSTRRTRARGPLPRPSPPPRRPEPPHVVGQVVGHAVASGPRLVDPPPVLTMLPVGDPRVDTGPQDPSLHRPISSTRLRAPSPEGAEEKLSPIARVREVWENAPMSTRVLLGVVVLLLIFLLGR